MRSKTLAGHEVGLARLSATLIAFLELVRGVGISHRAFHAFHTLVQTGATYCCTNLLISRFQICRHSAQTRPPP
jgi:hypothetical protein